MKTELREDIFPRAELLKWNFTENISPEQKCRSGTSQRHLYREELWKWNLAKNISPKAELRNFVKIFPSVWNCRSRLHKDIYPSAELQNQNFVRHFT